jgi:hypothetical protein
MKISGAVLPVSISEETEPEKGGNIMKSKLFVIWMSLLSLVLASGAHLKWK